MGSGAFFSIPIFALKPRVQAGRFEYHEDLFLSYKWTRTSTSHVDRALIILQPISMIGNLLENAPLYLQFFFVHKGSVLTTKLLLMYWLEHYV